MTKSASKNPLKHLRASDIRSVAQLATQGTLNVTHIAEGVHQSVWGTLGFPNAVKPAQTRGLTGLIYKSIRGITTLVGMGVDAALAKLQPLFDAADSAAPGTAQREAVLAALNGVMGDRLTAGNNPLATPMTFRYCGKALIWQTMPQIANARRSGKRIRNGKGRLLLLIHGLCMNDLQWQTGHNRRLVNHGEALAAELAYVPVYLRYNSGKHISQNGRELSAQLEQLAACWPQSIQELTVIAHSMGGLLIRSALHYANEAGLSWPTHLKNIVFLGTPHHGAPLERAGHWVDNILGSTPYSAPFSRLTSLRSAGITDLRYGYVVDDDWQSRARSATPRRQSGNGRKMVQLPDGVACYTIAATTAAKRSALADRLFGDGLVPLHSALGEHDDPRRNLAFAKSSKSIAYRTSHMALLSNPAVLRQMVDWLAPKVSDGQNRPKEHKGQ